MLWQPLCGMDANKPISVGFGSNALAYESKQGMRVFMPGLPEPGYINFGKTFEGYQSFFLEDGRLYAPRQLADLSFEAIKEACAFDMRTRHPNTFELLDAE